jgi:site-specific recombinase XerD
LSAVLLEWNDIQKGFKAPHHVSRRDRLRWIAVCLRCIVFVGYSGAPFWNRAFNLRLRAACRTIEVAQITAHGLRDSAATILLNHVGKDLREIQELFRHKNICTTVGYTTSATSRPGKPLRRSVKHWSESELL